MKPLPDSGSRTNFNTGAVRDASEGKGFPSDIPPCAIRRVAQHFERGAAKYQRGNFRLGIPLSRYYDSAIRHLLAWSENDQAEDHIAAASWNCVCAMWTQEEIEKGNLPPELNDLPYYKK